MYTVHVVGFVTDGGTGGFEWRVDEAEARRVRDEFATPDTDITPVRAVEIPDELGVPGKTNPDRITEWLDHNPELWEPSLGEGR